MELKKEQKGREKQYSDTVINIKTLAAKDGASNSVAAIGRRTGIPQSTLNNKMLNPQLLTLSDLYSLAYAFDVSVSELTQIRK